MKRYVAAFSISNYSTSTDRQTKPFNPMIGETYEFDRLDDLGWRSIGSVKICISLVD